MKSFRIQVALPGGSGGGARSEINAVVGEPSTGFDKVLDRTRAAEPVARGDGAKAPERTRGDEPGDRVHAPAQQPTRTPTPARGDAAKDCAERTPAARSSEGQPRAGAHREPTATDESAAAVTDNSATPAPGETDPANPAQLPLPLPSQLMSELQAATAAMVSAAQALAQHGGAAAAQADGAAAGEEPAAPDLERATPGMAAAVTQPARSAAAKQASGVEPAKVEPPLVAGATAEAQVRAPLRDRLLEDFERRFERSLAVSASGGREGFTPGTPQALAALAPTPAANLQPIYSVAHASLGAAVGQPAFAEEMSHRVLLFAGQRVQNAELALTPSDLGPIKVSIEMRGQEATLSFTAAHATTRAAIEDALPRLREMFAGQGLQLAHAHVGDQRRQDYGRPGHGARADNRSEPTSRIGAGGTGGLPNAHGARALGLIDIHV